MNMSKFFCQNEHGLVLPLVVLLLGIFSLLGFTALYLVQTQASLTQRASERVAALHYAEAGIDYYLSHVNENGMEPPLDESVSFGDGFFRLEKLSEMTGVDDEGEIIILSRTIRSTGEHAGSGLKRAIEVVVEPTGQKIVLSEDEEEVIIDIWNIIEWKTDP